MMPADPMSAYCLRLSPRVRHLRLKGMTQNDIAVELGITQGTVSTILRSIGLGGYLFPTKRVREKSA